MRAVSAFLLLTLMGSSVAAETTYWLPTVERTDSVVTYRYDTKAPDFFVPWVLQRTELGGGETLEKTIDGKSFTFVKQFFTWDSAKASPELTGQIRLDNRSSRHTSSDWKHELKLKENRELTAALSSAAKAGDGPWRELDLLVLRWEGDGPPGLRFSEPVPPVEQARARMNKLAKQTRPGEYFSDVQVPADLAAFRTAMLEIGNLGRRNPDFRRSKRNASDLSGESTRTDKGQEKVFKHNAAAPYFNALVLNDQLSAACQFHAEYEAQIQKSTHDGPANYKGADMRTYSLRLKHFGYTGEDAGEGAGASMTPSDFPEIWMNSETHYRPWFNIGADVRAVGLGAAKGKNDYWYFCKIGGVGEAATLGASPGGQAAAGSQPASSAASADPVRSPEAQDSGGGAQPAQPKVGDFIRLRAANYPDHFVRHENFLVFLRKGTASESDFELVQSRENADAIMFRARSHPDFLLRHESFRLKLHAKQDSALFHKDASFLIREALNGDPAYRSLESVNFPGQFLRHRQFEIWLDRNDGSKLFNKDASFKLETIK